MSFVSLTKEECREAARAAVERRLTNLFKELNNLSSHGYACGNAWASDIEAAGAEVAFAKFINKGLPRNNKGKLPKFRFY